MEDYENNLPIVLSFSANDPSGSAGIQADIETIGTIGGHCAPVITTITARDTANLYQFFPCVPQLVQAQAKAVLEDMPVAVFKIGVLGSLENIAAVQQILRDYPNVPVVWDPATETRTKTSPLRTDQLEAMMALILPLVKICTLNVSEAQCLAPQADTLDACAQKIMAHGVEAILITGQPSANKILNTLYINHRRLEVYPWDRLPNTYQGAGCTLSASLAAFIAQGLSLPSAVFQAQEYTHESLKQGYRIGMGDHLPNRFFWARKR